MDRVHLGTVVLGTIVSPILEHDLRLKRGVLVRQGIAALEIIVWRTRVPSMRYTKTVHVRQGTAVLVVIV